MSSLIGSTPSTATGQSNRPMAQTGNKIPQGYRRGQIQQFTPEMMDLFHNLFQHVGGGSFLSKLAGGDEEAFAQAEAPALQQFSGIQGNIASRFSGMGTGGRHSSGFQNSMNQASSDFAQQLQSNRMGLQRQALSDLFGLSNSLLGQRPYDQFLVKKEPDFLKKLFGGGAGAGVAGGAGYAASGGNPMMALLAALGGFGAGYGGQ